MKSMTSSSSGSHSNAQQTRRCFDIDVYALPGRSVETRDVLFSLAARLQWKHTYKHAIMTHVYIYTYVSSQLTWYVCYAVPANNGANKQYRTGVNLG
jgi:hypothetical protein